MDYFVNSQKQTAYLINLVQKGKFPKESVCNMNMKKLENFVIQLVELSNVSAAKNASGFQELCKYINDNNKPMWWPSEQVISQTLNANGRGLMALLKVLVYRCCEYFKKPQENLNDEFSVTLYDFRKLNRKNYDDMSDFFDSDIESADDDKNNKPKLKRRFLTVKLIDIFYEAAQKPKFLRYFELQPIDETIFYRSREYSSISSTIKFRTTQNIPISSDSGIELMKRDNYNCPKSYNIARLQKTERYINRSPSRKCSKTDFTICYKTNTNKENCLEHIYKFSRRKFTPSSDNNYFKKYRPNKELKVDLKRLKNFDLTTRIKPKLKIVLPRLVLQGNNKRIKNKTV